MMIIQVRGNCHEQKSFKNTIKAVETLGGMGKFVSHQSRVGLLINSPWRHPGSYVTPEVTLAVVRMCLDAGATEIGAFKSIGSAYWRRSPLSEGLRDEIGRIRDIAGNYTEVRIPEGRSPSPTRGTFGGVLA
jgi:hypothetical protein